MFARMELSVKQLAERLLPATADGDLDGLTRQLRHWTLSGILETLGLVHIGAGRARIYAESEVYYAALAMELARWRMPVGVSDVILRMTRGMNEHSAKSEKGCVFNRAIAGEPDIFLCVRLAGQNFETEVVGGSFHSLMAAMPEQKWTAAFPSFLAVNLTTLFAPLRG